MKILNDFTTSVRKSLGEIDPKYMDYPGVIVCGTHHPFNPDILIDEIEEARVKGLPFLGICFGHQLAAIEYARNVLGIEDAASEEWFDNSSWDDTTKGLPFFVVKKRPQLLVGLRDGETYWSNYDVDQSILDKWAKPANFITVPFHPEYQSSKDKPHPVLVEFINHCKNYEN